jgi:hypothetical protein
MGEPWGWYVQQYVIKINQAVGFLPPDRARKGAGAGFVYMIYEPPARNPHNAHTPALRTRPPVFVYDTI